MKRKLIPNVPVIRYDGNNAGMFTTVLEAALISVGEECDRAKLTALSGEGNRFAWVDGRWYGGCECPEAINETPYESERRILCAIGWDAKYVTVQRDQEGKCTNTDRSQIRRDFMSAIDKGFPVIARLIRQPECRLNLFFGYEDDGQRIICYDYVSGLRHGISTNNDAPIAVNNWEENIEGYILFQNKRDTASERNTALSAFKWVSEHARRTDKIRGLYLGGFAAWEAWISLLEHDDLTGLSPGEVARRFGPHCDAVSQINERRGALPYYRSLSEKFPEWREELDTAVAALEACVDHLRFMWTDEAAEFQSPAVRKKFAEAGRECMRKDMEAVEQFERILGTEGEARYEI